MAGTTSPLRALSTKANTMAYTNDQAERIVQALSSEEGFDLPDSIAIAHMLTQDDELLENLTQEQLRMVQTSAAQLGKRLLKLVLLINHIRT